MSHVLDRIEGQAAERTYFQSYIACPSTSCAQFLEHWDGGQEWEVKWGKGLKPNARLLRCRRCKEALEVAVPGLDPWAWLPASEYQEYMARHAPPLFWRDVLTVFTEYQGTQVWQRGTPPAPDTLLDTFPTRDEAEAFIRTTQRAAATAGLGQSLDLP